MHHNQAATSRRSSPRGFVFIMGLFVLSGLLALTATGLTRSMTDLTVATRSLSAQQALHGAEARLDAVLQTLMSNPDAVLPPGGPPVCPPLAPIYGQTNACQMTELPALPDARVFQVRVMETVNGTSQAVEAVMRYGTEGTPFTEPLYGKNFLYFAGVGTMVDSYDSRLGPYPYAGWSISRPRPITAPVRTDGQITIWGFLKPSYLWTNVHVAPAPGGDPAADIVFQDPQFGGPTTMEAVQMTIGGVETTSPVAKALTPILGPSGSSNGAPYIRGRCDDEEDRVRVFNVAQDSPSLISIGDDCRVVFKGDGVVYLDELTIGPTAKLDIRGNIEVVLRSVSVLTNITLTSGSLKMYVNGSRPNSVNILNMKNKLKDPTKLLLFVNNALNVDLFVQLELEEGRGVSVPFYGAVYAPDAPIFLHAYNSVYGSLISGKQVYLSFGSRVHYDEALRGMNLFPGQARLLSWRQCAQADLGACL